MNTYDRDIATPASATRDDAPARVTVASEADRRAHVAKWIARHHKSAAATLGTAVLFLPAVAGAQTAGEGLVDAAGIDGVQDVQLLDDGSARVTLDNGQVLNVSADDVVIGDAGEVQVSDQVADILAEQAATSGGGGGGASGGAIAAGAAAAAGVAAVAASGGGGGGGTSEGPTVVNSEDVAGFRTFSDVFGREPDGDPDSITITVEREGGNPVILTDPADRDDETGEWLLPDSFADEFEGLDNEEITVSFIAEKEVPPEDGDDNVVVDGEGTNEIRALNGPEPEPDVVDKGEVTLLVDTVAPEITIDGDIAGDGVLNIEERDDGFEITGTTSAEVGQEVRVGLAIPGDTDPIDVTGTVVAADDPDGPNEWRVTISPEQAAELGDGEDVDVLAVVDDAAGNPVDDRASATFTTDFTAPEIAINDVDEIGAAEAQNGLQITGTASGAEGQDVTVTFDGETYTGTVTAENWSVNIPDTAVQAVQDRADEDEQAEVEISATVEDAARNPAEETPTQTVTADFTGPSITINDIAEDNILNIAEREGDVTISGTTGNVGDGQEVTVAVGNETYTETVNGGTWSATLPQADAASLEDGTEIEVTAEVSDEDDVAATPATTTLVTDFTAPEITIDGDIAGDDGVLNIAEQDEGLTISGTTDAEIGQDVTVTLSRGVGMDIVANATVVEAADPPGLNEWSVTYTPEQLQDLGPETEVTVEATVDDAAGNPADTPATATFETDFTAPTVGIDALPLGGDGTLNAAESDSDLEITGTATDTDEVAVTFNGTELAPATVTDDSWSVTVAAAELQDLDPEATIDVQATAKDAAGNTAEEDTSFDTDFTAPELTVDPLTIGEFLSIAEAESAVTVTGTVAGNDGEDVTFAVGDQQETATVDQQGGWTATFAAGALSGLDDGETAFAVTTQDAAGNEASVDSDAFTVDLTAPEITVDDPPPQPFTLGLDAVEETDGFGFTTAESGDATVTLTFTRADGTEDFSLTEQLSDIDTFNDGDGDVYDFPLTPENLATLEDQTEYDVEIAITDAAGNTGTDGFTLTTDFQPEIALDQIGEDGVLILDEADPDAVSVSGTTRGVEAGQAVTVTILDAGGESLFTEDSATVAPDGTWTLDLPSETVEALEAGQSYDVQADVSNVAGRDAPQATGTFNAYQASGYDFVSSDVSETTFTIDAIGNENLDSSSGLALNTIMTFDPSAVSYVEGSVEVSDPFNILTGDGVFTPNDQDADTGTVVFGGSTSIEDLALPQEFYSFDVETQGSEPFTLSFVDDEQGGPTELQIGTSSADDLTASRIDSTIQGRGGDDTLDLSGAGVNTVLFEAAPEDNGVDTVTEFSVGGSLPDRLGFAGLDNEALRGNGAAFERLGEGDSVGLDTGLIVFTTAMTDLEAASAETAVEGLDGPGDGDVFYFLASDETDSALYEVEVTAGEAAATKMASFEGVDLSGISDANILGFESNPVT